MGKLKLWLGVILLFVSGLVIGSLITGHYFRAHFIRFAHGGPGKVNEHIVARLTRELRLSDEQREQIEQIRLEADARLREIDDQFRPQIESVIDQQHDDIMAVLDEDQKRTLNERFEEMRERRGRFMPKDRPGERDRRGPEGPFPDEPGRDPEDHDKPDQGEPPPGSDI